MTAAALSVNIITKDCPEALSQCLDSIGSLLREGDEIVIVDTGSSPENLQKLHSLRSALQGPVSTQVIERPDLAVDFVPYIRRWLPEWEEKFLEFYGDSRMVKDFAAARQVARLASKNPLIFWIDCDDIFTERQAGKMRELVDKHMAEHDSVFLDYLYAFDPQDGKCITTLRRERFFWRDKFEWKGACHETAIPRPGVAIKPMALFEGAAEIRHTEHRKPSEMSDVRNYVILRDEYERHGAAVDPRTIFYLGNAARGLRRFREACQLYEQFDVLSGSPDDRYAAHYYRGTMYLDPEVQRPVDARDAFTRCVEICPEDPRGYFGLSRAYYALQRFRDSLRWYEFGLTVKMPRKQVFSYDPTHIEFHPHVVAANAARELGDYSRAVEIGLRALASRPNHPDAELMQQQLRNLGATERLLKGFEAIFANLQFGGPNAKRVANEICAELTHVPSALEKRGVNKLEDPDPREPKPELAIFCGETTEEWGPGSRFTGIGGSEKMAILLSEALQAKGHWNVSVYASVPRNQRGVDENSGVLWRHWSEFDEGRPRDVFVAWRMESYLGLQVRARKRVLWCHDVQNPQRYTEKILALADHVQLQSEFHLRPIKEVVPKKKIWVARNAIETYQTADCPRNPKQVLYCSSPDRGLHTALQVFKRAKAKDPELELVICYGITPYARRAYANAGHLHFPDLGRDCSAELYEKEVFRLADEVGAVVLNRVDFEKLSAVMLGSGVWLYPTRFPEISCMAAMETQALGCVPVTTRYGALAETVLPYAETMASPLPDLPASGDPSEVWFAEAADILLRATQIEADSPRRLELAKQAWEAYNVQALADEWTKKLQVRSRRGSRADVAAGAAT